MRGPVLVGREHQLAELDGLLSEARRGAGSVVVVDGDPGMGKTAVARVLFERADAAGMARAWGACWEGEGAPAFRPWRQVLSAVGAHPDVLRDPGDERGRFAVFDDVVGALRTAAEAGGLLVVLDDVHRADTPSLRLLQALAADVPELPVLVVCLRRAGDPGHGWETADVLAAVLRSRGASRLTLPPLTAPEVATLSAAVLGARPPASLLTAVVRRAEGNPLFVLELLRLHRAGAAPELALPAGVRQVIAQRVDRLPPLAATLLRQAAVLGRDFPVDLLARVTGCPAHDVDDALAAWIRADLVVRSAPGMARFGHALTQEVAYAEQASEERERLHLEAARALTDAPAGPDDDRLDTIAHHLRRAGDRAERGAARAATVAAARRARAVLADEHAVHHYGTALSLPGASPPRRRLLLELAECQFRTGAVADAWGSCRRAADAGRAADDPRTVAEAALVVRGLTNDPICAAIHALCEEALVLLDGRDPVLHAKLLAQLVVTGDPRAAGPEAGLSRRALDIAETTGDADARFLALQARHAVLGDFAAVDERRELARRAVELGQRSVRPQCTAWGLIWRMDGAWQRADRTDLDAAFSAYGTLVQQVREPLGRWRLRMVTASLALLEGRFGRAQELAAEALSIGRRGGHREAEFMDLVLRQHLAAQVGDERELEQIEATVRDIVRDGPPDGRGWHAHVLAGMGRLEDAAAVLGPERGRTGRHLPRHTVEWVIGACATAELSQLLDEPGIAEGLALDLLPMAGFWASARAQSPSMGPIALTLGRLAIVRQDWPEAIGFLETAVRLAERMVAAPYQAIATAELARAHLYRRGPGDVATAAAGLARAATTADVLGMRPLAAQVAGLQQVVAASRASTLSPREDQIAALVADGLSNRRIAEQLRLSERTVEAHVRSIFIRLGVDSRIRIATWYLAQAAQQRSAQRR